MGATAAQYVAIANAQIGKPYVYATQGPDSFDCSGLVLYCCQQVGITTCPRTSEDQWGWVQRCDVSQVEPGVLVFSNFPGEESPGHIQICTGYGETTYVGADNSQVGVETGNIAGDNTGGGVIVGYGYIPGLTYGAAGQIPVSGQTSTSSLGSTEIPAFILAGMGGVFTAGFVSLVAVGLLIPIIAGALLAYALSN